MQDQAEPASLSQESARHAADYNQRLAVELFALLPAERDQAKRVLAYIDAMLNLELPPPNSSEKHL